MKIDRQLQKDVMDELEFDPSVVAEHIAVSVSDGIVTLKGHVPSYAEKYAAEKAAFRVAGVKAVVEEIEVQLPGMKLRRDEEIAKAAADALLWNVLVPSSVQVTVENSRVILRGEVDWAYQIKAATRAVSCLTGITGVTNHLRLRSQVQPQDVKQRIEKALIRSAEKDAKKIKVEMHDGEVVLSGSVRSRAALEDAKWAAWAVPGVMNVETQLSVDSSVLT